MPRTKLNRYFEDYQTFHRTSGNRICHYIAIPWIVISILGLLGSWVPIIGIALLLGVAIWYLLLDWRLGFPFLFIGAGLYCLGRSIPVPALWVIFVAGWILQFVGHGLYEKNSPAFFKTVEHLLIGPLWVLAKFLGSAGSS
jgi:uncharacterized membrane protein YGL010W